MLVILRIHSVGHSLVCLLASVRIVWCVDVICIGERTDCNVQDEGVDALV